MDHRLPSFTGKQLAEHKIITQCSLSAVSRIPWFHVTKEINLMTSHCFSDPRTKQSSAVKLAHHFTFPFWSVGSYEASHYGQLR